MIDPLKDIDWNLVWKRQMKRNLDSSPGRDCARIWESRESALSFWNMCHQERSRIDKTVWETDITEESRVLDIGACPGTLAIHFAGPTSMLYNVLYQMGIYIPAHQNLPAGAQHALPITG